MKQNSLIYLGLFLIAFALYAKEKNEDHAAFFQREVLTPVLPLPALPETGLDQLYAGLAKSPALNQSIDGLKLRRLDHAVEISLQNDELYRDGETAIESTWYPVLEKIGKALSLVLTEDNRVNLVGYANSLNEIESRGSAFQQSPFVFSLARAEWLYHFWEEKFSLTRSQARFVLSGGGALPNGKRLEIRIEAK